MKWLLVIALSLALVLVCVVYFHHATRPLPEIVKTPAQTPIAKPSKTVRPLPAKPSLQGPVDISGPLKDRDLISWVLPDYPDWAQEKGLAGTLRLKLWVTPAGEVKSLIETLQMSADPRLDEKAKEALHQWRFTQKANTYGDQWGIVTVRYSLLAQEVITHEASFRGVSLGGSTASGAWHCIKEWIGHEYVYYCRLVNRQVE